MLKNLTAVFIVSLLATLSINLIAEDKEKLTDADASIEKADAKAATKAEKKAEKLDKQLEDEWDKDSWDSDSESVKETEKKASEMSKAQKEAEKAEEDTKQATSDAKSEVMEESSEDEWESDSDSAADKAKERKNLTEAPLKEEKELKNAKKEEKKAKAEVKKIKSPAKTSPLKTSTVQEPSIKKKCCPSGKELSTTCKVIKSIAMYIPNRLMDAFDIFGFQFGFGPELSGEIQVTNYLKAIGFIGEKYFIGKGYNRQFGGGHTDGWEFDVFCFTSSYRYLDNVYGTYKDEFVFDGKSLHIPFFKHNIYDDGLVDFWAVGVRAGWLVNVGFEIHPVDIADFVTGIFLIDIKNDDVDDTAIIRIE
jgi:hypothetical protein